MVEKLKGIIPAMATPLTEDGRPDEAGIRTLVSYQLTHGVNGFFPCGSTGEGPMLRDEDWEQVNRWVLDEVNGKVPVLVNIADTGTARVIERGKRAVDFGAQYLVTTLPYYYVHAGQEAEDFCTAVADGVEAPLYIYNLPQRTQVALSADMLERLSKHPNLYGVKDSSVDPILHFELIHRLRDTDFVVLNGCEFFVGASVMMGGDGGLLGICNVCPQFCVELYEAAAQGDIPGVRRLQPIVSDLTGIFFTQGGSPLSALKHALHLMGICGPTTLSPFQPTTPEQEAIIRDKLVRNGLL